MRIVHHLPGRLRLRVPPSVDGDALLDTLARVPGVRSCRWSARTRGLLVLYEPDGTTGPAIVETLREGNGRDGGPSGPIEPGHRAPAPTLAHAVTEAVGTLDEGVRRITRNTMGLGGLVPLALTLWAVREIAVGRAGPLAWSSALWYAHGLFRDYNPPRP